MCHLFTENTTVLQTFSQEEPIYEINEMINLLANTKLTANMKDRIYDRIKGLKHMTDNIINNM